VITFFAPGQPAAQGSKRHVGNGVMLETNPHLKSWRSVVAGACLDATSALLIETPIHRCLRMEIIFFYPRPQAHYGKRKGERYLKPTAPTHKQSTPDLDKLVRAIGDALKGVAYVDDALVVELQAAKVYTEAQAGAHITLIPLDK
jgi:crossover junction endodeoxyribonuclease RusA